MSVEDTSDLAGSMGSRKADRDGLAARLEQLRAARVADEQAGADLDVLLRAVAGARRERSGGLSPAARQWRALLERYLADVEALQVGMARLVNFVRHVDPQGEHPASRAAHRLLETGMQATKGLAAAINNADRPAPAQEAGA